MLHKSLTSTSQGTRKSALNIVTLGMTSDRLALIDDGVMLTIAMGDSVLTSLFRRLLLNKEMKFLNPADLSCVLCRVLYVVYCLLSVVGLRKWGKQFMFRSLNQFYHPVSLTHNTKY